MLKTIEKSPCANLNFLKKRTIGSTKNKTTTIFCSFSFFFSAGITITKNYLRKKYIDSGRDQAFLNLVSLVRSCVGSLAAVFFNFCLTLFVVKLSCVGRELVKTHLCGGWEGRVGQGPLNIWTEHSNCQIHRREDSKTLLIPNIFLIFFDEIIFLCIKKLRA